jgi:glucose/mannose-6-phosphate isomerase
MQPMDLDDLDRFRQLDTRNMLAEIDGLPDQLERAWELGQSLLLPSSGAGSFSSAVIAGMGGSAIGGDLVEAWARSKTRIPIVVHRNYGLPAFAEGKQVLVVASSHSGETEETLDAFATGIDRGCTVVAVATGGSLARAAGEKGVPTWKFEHSGQPRAAIGFSFGLLLALFSRLGLIPNPEAELEEALQAMRKVQPSLQAQVHAAQNPAKRYAGQLMGRWITVFAAGLMEPVARRLKTQINEIAKAGANFEFLPEADHNALAGTVHPDEVLMPHCMNLFVRSPSDDARNRRRLDLTKQAYMLEGLNTDFLDARGRGPLANMWTMILFGDYMAYYLAMAYGVDPTAVTALVNFKDAMKRGG